MVLDFANGTGYVAPDLGTVTTVVQCIHATEPCAVYL